MRRSKAIVAASAFLIAVGCDPILTMKVGQTLRPPPQSECILAALREAPGGAAVVRGSQPPEQGGFDIALPDASGSRRWLIRVSPGERAPESADSATARLVVVARYLSPNTPNSQGRKAIVTSADSLLAAVRSRCGGVPVKTSCSYEKLGWWKIRTVSCSAG